MQFTGVGYDENGIISFLTEGDGERQYNPFLIASQAMFGRRVLDDYHGDCQNLIPQYVPLRYLLDAEITPDMERAIQWLLAHVSVERDHAYWLYSYPVSYGAQHLEKGWKSAFGQAYVSLAMLFFYLKTGRELYRKYAVEAIRGMTENQADGGCMQVIGADQIWFEEIPARNATHIFNAHLIGMIAIAQLQRYLGITEFDICFAQAFHAFKEQMDWMDTGIMSAYDRPKTISFQLQLDSREFANDVFIGAVSIEDGSSKAVIDLAADDCFTPGVCYASGIDWSTELDADGNRKLVDGRSIRKENAVQGTMQNTYLNFGNISTEKKILKMKLAYSAGSDTRLLLKKNCGDRGYQKLGFYGEIMLLQKEKVKEIELPTRCLLPDLSMVYHKYHMVLLEELLHVRYDHAIHKLLARFESYGRDKDPVIPQPRLEALSVCVNTKCGMSCKMCDIGIQNQEASLYQNLQGGGQNEILDPGLLIRRCKESGKMPQMIHLVGTEPTLYRELPMLIQSLKELEKQVLVTTNGIHLKEMLVPMLDAGVDKILISIDGPERLHDEIRGRKGLFAQIMQVLKEHQKEIKKAEKRGFEVAACCAVTPMNYLYLPEMVQEIGKQGIRNIWCTHMNYVDVHIAKLHNASHRDYPIGPSCIHEKMNPKKVNPWLMSESIRAARQKALSLHMEFVEAPQITNVDDYEKLYHRPQAIVGQKICTAPFRTMQINADGSACVMSRCYQMKMGNLKDHTLMELFYSCEMEDLRRQVVKQEQWDPCKRCCAIM